MDDSVDSQAVPARHAGGAGAADVDVVRPLRQGLCDGGVPPGRGAARDLVSARVEQAQLRVQVGDVIEDLQLNGGRAGGDNPEQVPVVDALHDPGRGINVAGRGEDRGRGRGPAVVVG